jgi:hypothetical protein
MFQWNILYAVLYRMELYVHSRYVEDAAGIAGARNGLGDVRDSGNLRLEWQVFTPDLGM